MCDFGFAQSLQGPNGDGHQYTVQGTPKYRAPEIELCHGPPYQGEGADLFSLGVCLFAIVTGKFPFEHATCIDKHYKHLINARHDSFWSEHEKHLQVNLSPDLKELIQEMLEPEPTLRLSMAEVAAHPYFSHDWKVISLKGKPNLFMSSEIDWPVWLLKFNGEVI